MLDDDQRVLAGKPTEAARRCARSRRRSCRRPARRAAAAAAPASAACRSPATASARATAVRASRSHCPATGRSACAPSAIASRCSDVSLARSVPNDSLARLHRELEVLEHAVLLEHGRLLELAADARRARSAARVIRSRSIVWPKNARAGIGPRLAGDHVHHRGLAGAVRADDAAQLADVDRRASAGSAP